MSKASMETTDSFIQEILGDEVPIGPVQTFKDAMAARELAANKATPEGMDFLGWVLDGWISSYPLLEDKARPVYAFVVE